MRLVINPLKSCIRFQRCIFTTVLSLVVQEEEEEKQESKFSEIAISSDAPVFPLQKSC